MAKLLNRLGDQILTSRSIGDIGGNAQCLAASRLDLGSNSVALLLPTTGDDDSSTVSGHRVCDRVADASGRTGDNGNLVLQIIAGNRKSHIDPLLLKIMFL